MTAATRDALVLIHGGEHGGWCWDRVISHLRHRAVAVTLPGRDDAGGSRANLRLADYVDHTRAIAAATGSDNFVVVAHSLGGLTACGLAAAMPDQVRHLVFVSCMIPAEGGRAIDNGPRALRPFLAWRFRRALSGAGTHQLPGPIARRMFCSDLDAHDTEEVLRRRCPEPAGIPLERFSLRGFPAEIPRTWVRLRRDRALAPRVQDRMVKNLGGADIIEIDSGHDVMIGRPVELADVLNEIADRSFRPRGIDAGEAG